MGLSGEPGSDGPRRERVTLLPEMANRLVMRGGRRLEVWEYGDPGGHPAFFFHGLIGSHHQASFIADEARRRGLRIIAPNRPGVGHSEFTTRRTAFGVVTDVEDVAEALGLDEFSLIGISGGAPYVLATLDRLGRRVTTATLISGMGPMRLPGALQGMRPSDRLSMEIGSRAPRLARREFQRWSDVFRADPERFLRGFMAKLVPADLRLFQQGELYNLFRQDLREVFVEGIGPTGLAQELVVYRNLDLPLGKLPADRCVILWHGLADDLVPPAMAFQMARRLPNCEAHFVPGGHFVAFEVAEQIISRLMQKLEVS
jgi:pimeloyl-ACP methyl ester carboxylesterase